MLGLAATIIAAVKGHKTYAWVTGIWTAIAVAVGLSGYTEYAIAPGFVFFAIAVSMDNLRKQKKKDEDDGSECDDKPALIEEKNKSIEIADTSENSYTYFCTTCNSKFNEWYDKCPNCDAENTIKGIEAQGPQKSAFKEEQVAIQDGEDGLEVLSDQLSSCEEASRIEEIMPIRYCRKCGKELLEGAIFCRECGTRVQRLVNIEKAIISDTVEKSDSMRIAPYIDISSLPPVLRRAYILTEDEEWGKANEYFERILDEDPENAYAYIGKALVDIKVNTIEELTDAEIVSICKTNNFKRALMYANKDVKSLLKYWQDKASETE